jgi:hypothetical protein
MANMGETLTPVVWNPAIIVLSEDQSVCHVIGDDGLIQEFEHSEDDGAFQIFGEYGWGFFPTMNVGNAVFVQFVCSRRPFEGMPGPSLIMHMENPNEDVSDNKDDDDAVLFHAIECVIDAKFDELRHTA